MGTIFSGVGLATGLDITSIVDNLVAVSARPRDLLLSRIGNIDAQRASFLDISARISAMLANLTTLSSRSSFNATTATSSQPDVLGVTTTSAAVPGSYDFIVKQLATSHQLVSRGFASRQDRLATGTLTIESAKARVNTSTDLDELNGYRGVQRGEFTITNAAGAEATINIRDALTVNDVIDRINESGIAVRAELVGDSIRLTETTGGVVRVGEVDGAHVAADLGFAAGNTSSGASGNADELVGGALISLSSQTPLSRLNDGNGVRTAKAGGDFTINGVAIDLSTILKPDTRLDQLNGGAGVDLGTIRVKTFTENGSEITHEIDLAGLTTIDEVKSAIETAVPDTVVTLTSSHLVVGYTTDAADGDEQRRLVVEDVSGSAARDLGIAGDSETGRINGGDVLTMRSVQDMLAAINFAHGNDGSISASIDGTRIVIDAGGAAVGLEPIGESKALYDLGFEPGGFRDGARGARLIGGVNTSLISSLNGGRGYDLGAIQLTVGDLAAGGQSVEVDLSGFETLGEIVDAINAASDANGLGITAGYDRNGTRLTIRSDDGVTAVAVKDVKDSGTFAADAGLINQSGADIRSANLQKQYLSENTLLEVLNSGAGVSTGKIKITNSDGAFVSVDLSSARTLGDVIQRINAATFGGGDAFTVTARINDSGDGIVLEDSATGTFELVVEDQEGTAARDLKIAGSSDTSKIDGSFEVNIDVSSSDTLDDLLRRINEESGLASASVLNDGSEVNPYRLQIAAKQSGLAGELLIDDAGLGLDLATLSRAQDAAVVLGGADSGFVMTSSTNTLTDVVPGMTLTLSGVSDQPVSVTVGRNTEDVVSAVDSFVSAFNDAISRIDELTDYDPDTERAGLLLGDSTVQTVERRLFRLVTGSAPDSSGPFRRLSELGIRYDGGSVTFDTEKFAKALADKPEAVADFFADKEGGVAQWMKQQIEEITEADGTLDRRSDALERRKDDLTDRVDRLNELLNRKRDRLTRQFINMETAISQLQSQQSSLAQLGALANSAK